MSDASVVIDAWIDAMEAAQPQLGPLLQSTVDEVGYPAVGHDGTVLTLKDGMAFHSAVGFTRGYARQMLLYRSNEALGRQYPACEAAGDEAGMARAQDRYDFYRSFADFVEAYNPDRLPRPAPAWLVALQSGGRTTETPTETPTPTQTPSTPDNSTLQERTSSMPVSLSKGAKVSLTKIKPTLARVRVGLGWDARTTTGADFDLDAVALVCGADGKVLDDSYFVFFNNLKTPDGSVEHGGDNLTGQGEGDDEVVHVDLTALPPAVERVVIAVSIYEDATHQTTFGQVQNAFIRVVDAANDNELARYDLSEDASVETVMVFGQLEKDASGWSFTAVGRGVPGGLAQLVTEHGVKVA